MSKEKKPSEAEWLWISGYVGNYAITVEGEVISLKKKLPTLMKPTKNKKGYLQVELFHKGKRKRKFVHRLVAEAFIQNPHNKPQINHKNGIKHDNRVENLEWCTSRENVLHSYKTGLKKGTKKTRGELNGSSKLTNIQVKTIKRFKNTGIKYAVIAKMFGVSKATISNIFNNISWKHI